MSMFKKAVRYEKRARVAIAGASGSGKTYTALSWAAEFAGEKRFVVVDTEHGSASLYSDDFDFDTIAPTSFSPEDLPKIVKAAEAEGYGAIVIDSWSHYWNAEDGTLEQVDKRKNKPQHRGNSFSTWVEVTPIFRRMVASLLATDMHVIVTMRSKTEYVLEENDRGKMAPRKVGMAPIMRDGVEFEFDVVAEMENSTKPTMHVTKTRYKPFNNQSFVEPGAEQAAALLQWLGSGEAAPAADSVTHEISPPAPQIDPQQSAVVADDWLVEIGTARIPVDLMVVADGVKESSESMLPADLARVRAAWKERKLELDRDDLAGVIKEVAL